MESVNIGGTWREVLGVWVNIGGTWRLSRERWANIGGTWRKLPVKPYILGQENYPIVSGGTSQGSLAKESQNLYIYANRLTGDSAFAQYETDIQVDVTPFGKLSVDWRQFGTYGTLNIWAKCGLVNSKGLSPINASDWVALIDRRVNGFARTVDELDISGISGSYYLKIAAVNDWIDPNSFSEIRAWKLWLD